LMYSISVIKPPFGIQTAVYTGVLTRSNGRGYTHV